MVNNINLTLIALCLMFTANGQSFVDAGLMFSTTQAGGTARIQGFAGTQVSLGGDPSMAIGNPAGLGMSNRSSFSVTGGFMNNQTITSYYGSSTPGSKFNLQIPQLGMIFYSKGNDSDFKGGAFSFNYSRTDDYNMQINYGGSLPDNSIIDYFIDQATVDPSEFEEYGTDYNTLTGMGYRTFLIDLFYDENSNSYYYDTDATHLPDEQIVEANLSGRQNQWNFSYGGNYKDKLFFGLGMGIVNVKYNKYEVLNEYYPMESNLMDITIEEDLTITGTGLNATLGVIGRPLDFLQLGFSYTSPTKINLNDSWFADLEANWDNYYIPYYDITLNNETASTDILDTDYSMVTPGKLALGATAFFGKHGFISADVESIDYSKMRFGSGDFSMTPENQEVLQRFTSAMNFRLGTEFRYDIFRFRGGVASYGNPYSSSEELEYNPYNEKYTLGIGIRKKNKFVDVAFVRSINNSGVYPYTVQGAGEIAISEISNTALMFTFGWNF